MKTHYVTTPIYYVNAEPHIGHAYTTILADVVTRSYKILGFDTFFSTGTDEHGEKIAQTVQAKNKNLREYVDYISGKYRKMWEYLGITYNRFVRTTDEYHMKTVQDILQKIYDQGEIYLGEFSGNYCTGCERFLSDDELVNGCCPDHKTVPEFRKEKNYYFKMSAYQDWLIDHIQKNPEFIRPQRYRNEVLSFLKEPLKDLCISRPKTRLEWGIAIPFDPEFVTYVWFDALLNYVSVLDYPHGKNFAHYWQSAEHLIAKDILKPHGIYWPTMLKAAGIEPYQHLTVHGYWQMSSSNQPNEVDKISKSLGNAVDPLDIGKRFGIDALRYVLISEMIFGQDANFSEDLFKERYNSDLANDLGNLSSRLITMIHKYHNGTIPNCGTLETVDQTIYDEIKALPQKIEDALKEVKFHLIAKESLSLIRNINRYLGETEPWKLEKQGKNERVTTILHIATLALLTAARGFFPIMPTKIGELLQAFGCPTLSMSFTDPISLSMIKVQESVNLFPRIEKEMVEKAMTEKATIGKGMEEETEQPSHETKTNAHSTASDSKSAEAPEEKANETELIDFDTFMKVDLRTATITHAERIPKADKLLRLEVSLGSETRQILAGIAEYYVPEDLIGKQVIIVANLKPRKMKGLESQGMVLAVDFEGKLAYLNPSFPMPNGLRVR